MPIVLNHADWVFFYNLHLIKLILYFLMVYCNYPDNFETYDLFFKKKLKN